MIYLVLKTLHVLGASVIFGTGSGIAFFMLMAHRTRDTLFIAQTARIVVIADVVFTATSVIAQPITGLLLVRQAGYSFKESWLAVSLGLYLAAGAFWLPVIWMQIRMRDLALSAASANSPLPAQYHRLFGLWFLFGFPGFGAVLAIIILMVARPTLY